MIITAIIAALIGLIQALILILLPPFNGLPAASSGAMSEWISVLGKANSIIPIDTIITIVILMVSIEVLIFVFRLAEWIWSKFFPTGQMRLF